MPDVSYKGYTINVRAIQYADGGWEALAMVWSKDRSAAQPIVTGDLQVTEAGANAVALERAKAWVVAKQERKGT